MMGGTAQIGGNTMQHFSAKGRITARNEPHCCLCTGSALVVQSRNTHCAAPVHTDF